MIYIELFANFFMTGLFSVGGGLATLPFLYDMSDRTGWFSHADIANMLAISESTPGAIGINMASYAGYTVAGIPGDIAAAAGLVTPGIIVIVIIARLLDKFRSNKYVDWAFYGLRAASIGLIAAAGASVIRVTMLNGEISAASGSFFSALNIKAIILAALIFVLMKKFKKIHPVYFIAASALIGVIFSFAGV